MADAAAPRERKGQSTPARAPADRRPEAAAREGTRKTAEAVPDGHPDLSHIWRRQPTLRSQARQSERTGQLDVSLSQSEKTTKRISSKEPSGEQQYGRSCFTSAPKLTVQALPQTRRATCDARLETVAHQSGSGNDVDIATTRDVVIDDVHVAGISDDAEFAADDTRSLWHDAYEQQHYDEPPFLPDLTLKLPHATSCQPLPGTDPNVRSPISGECRMLRDPAFLIPAAILQCSINLMRHG